MKRFCDISNLQITWKKNQPVQFTHMAAKVVINSKETSATITAGRSLFGRLLILAKSPESFLLSLFLEFLHKPIQWSLKLPEGGMVKTCRTDLIC